MLHRNFCFKLYDQKTMSVLLNTFEGNMFNTKIIEKSLTIDVCKYMSFTNMCYGRKMQCENGVCSHKREPIPVYRWW